MAHSVYVAGVARGAGKSVVALGIAELLSRRVDRLGLFRPLVADANDRVLTILRERYRIEAPPEQLYGTTYAEATRLTAEGHGDELVARIVDRYRAAARPGRTMLVVGSDLDAPGEDERYRGVPNELAFHARLANEFGSVMVPVIDAHRRGSADDDGADRIEELADGIAATYHTLCNLGATVLGIVVSRVPSGERDKLLTRSAGLPVPVYVIPEVPALAAPTFAEVVSALHARMVLGDGPALARDVRRFVVGGATVPNFLDFLKDGCLMITPGDRADLIVAACAVHASGAATLAGIILTLGIAPDPRVVRLVQQCAPDLPMAAVTEGSFNTVNGAGRIEPKLTTDNPRKIEIALTTFEDSINTAELGARISVARSSRVTPMMFEYDLIERARSTRRRVVLPEGSEDRVLLAADVLLRRGVADLTLLGDPSDLNRRARELNINIDDAAIVDPVQHPWREEFAKTYVELRKHKNVPFERAYDTVSDVSYFGTLMVQSGYADGMVSGAVHTTAATIRPAFEVIKTRSGVGVASSVFFMCLADRVLVYGDCAINPDPDAAQLADIAISSAETAARFGVEPRVAMLSYSTGTSGHGADVEKVAAATELVRQRKPNLPVEGPIQYDAAIDPTVAATKLPNSAVAGRATVFVFPDLNTGNNTYKAVQRSAGAVAVGPVLQGLRRPVNDLSRGATVTDIINTVAITAIQAADEQIEA